MALPKNVDDYLTRRYYDKRLPGSFTSASKLHRVIRSEGRYHIPLKRIEKWAEGQDILTLHKTPRQRQPVYRRLVMPGPGHLWDVDLLVLNGRRFVESNDGYSYILIAIDVFSRYCYAQPVKNKGSKEMEKAFNIIFERSRTVPRFIRSDHGNEFSNAAVQELFRARDIRHYYANTETKANYAERMVKTMKTILFKFFQQNNSYAYEKDLQTIVKSYNSTFHQSIGRAPKQVTKENQQEVWEYQYVKHSKAYMTSLKRALKKANGGAKSWRRVRRRANPHKFRYAIGQTVRAAHFRSRPFDRAYDEQFTGEIFTVRRREVVENIPIYFLNGYDGKAVKGHFYESEITAVKYDPNALFKIEKVVKTRVRNGVKESLVKFQSWPSLYNQWLPTSSLVALKGSHRSGGSSATKSAKFGRGTRTSRIDSSEQTGKRAGRVAEETSTTTATTKAATPHSRSDLHRQPQRETRSLRSLRSGRKF